MMIFIYYGKFTPWTDENQKVVDTFLSSELKKYPLIVYNVECSEEESWSESLKKVANTEGVYYSATPKRYEEVQYQTWSIKGEEVRPNMNITGIEKGKIVYDFANLKNPELKDYTSWFKFKKFSGKIHNADFSKPMTRYGNNNNVTQNGTKGYMNFDQDIVSLEEGENKIHMSIGDLQFLAMESMFFDTQIEKPEYPTSFCCDFMESHLKQGECEQHGNACPDKAFDYKSGKWTLKAPNAYYVMFHCPFCGSKLEGNKDEQDTYQEIIKKEGTNE